MNLTNISSRSEKKFIFVIEYNSKGCTIDELKLLLFYLFIYSFFFGKGREGWKVSGN